MACDQLGALVGCALGSTDSGSLRFPNLHTGVVLGGKPLSFGFAVPSAGAWGEHLKAH